MGGEKFQKPTDMLQGMGSPPHGRGKDILTTFDAGKLRITPAWAGKSISQTSTMKPARDHPRMGGEKAIDSIC